MFSLPIPPKSVVFPKSSYLGKTPPLSHQQIIQHGQIGKYRKHNGRYPNRDDCFLFVANPELSEPAFGSIQQRRFRYMNQRKQTQKDKYRYAHFVDSHKTLT